MAWHYEYYEEDSDRADACNKLLAFLQKLKIGVKNVDLSVSWGGDITLTVEYLSRQKPERDARQR